MNEALEQVDDWKFHARVGRHKSEIEALRSAVSDVLEQLPRPPQ